ncbi:unnamed protein product [Lymnaea stagnalis]|uniref:Uncharacterized protein n=1 Tax=Lymnaea stagnalis TaxID=6523 RepID=A0AAV2GYY9_LYMST
MTSSSTNPTGVGDSAEIETLDSCLPKPDVPGDDEPQKIPQVNQTEAIQAWSEQTSSPSPEFKDSPKEESRKLDFLYASGEFEDTDDESASVSDSDVSLPESVLSVGFLQPRLSFTRLSSFFNNYWLRDWLSYIASHGLYMVVLSSIYLAIVYISLEILFLFASKEKSHPPKV